MSLSDDELDGLLGAYALDAVDETERLEVDAYLQRSSRAREEVRQHHEVAMALATTPGLAPTALWGRIELSMNELVEHSEPRFIARSQRRGSRRRGRDVLPGFAPAVSWPTWSVPAAAAAFALVVGFASIATVRQQSTIERLRTDVAIAKAAAEDGSRRAAAAERILLNESAVQQRTIKRLLATKGTSVASLETADKKTSVDIVLATNGQGYLVSKSLPALAEGRTYQLWGVSGDQVLSLGILGSEPRTLEFAAHDRWTKFVLTEEVSPGVASSKQPALAVGDVHSI